MYGLLNIARRIAGQYDQQYLISADTVAQQSRPQRARTNASVVTSAATLITQRAEAQIQMHGAAMKRAIQRYTSGYMQSMESLRSVCIVAVLKLSNGQTYHMNTSESVMTGFICVVDAISTMTAGIKHSSVISKELAYASR